jgi:hypothetical protein
VYWKAGVVSAFPNPPLRVREDRFHYADLPLLILLEPFEIRKINQTELFCPVRLPIQSPGWQAANFSFTCRISNWRPVACSNSATLGSKSSHSRQRMSNQPSSLQKPQDIKVWRTSPLGLNHTDFEVELIYRGSQPLKFGSTGIPHRLSSDSGM